MSRTVHPPSLDRNTPPLEDFSGPFTDDLDACDRRFGVVPRPSAPTVLAASGRGRAGAPRVGHLPLGPQVAWRAAYGGRLAPLTFRIKGGTYEAKPLAGNLCSLAEVLDAVLAAWPAVLRSELLSPRRHKRLTWPRFAFYVLALEFTGLSLPQIGRAFGNRDHSTVWHGARRGHSLFQESREFQVSCQHARRLIEALIDARRKGGAR